MKRFLVLSAVIALVTLVGCGGTKDKSKDGKQESKADDGHSHEHAPGPHGGEIIDLGHEHKYHAELVEDHDTKSLTVYLFDGDMKPVETTEKHVTLTLTVDAKASSFKLSPKEVKEKNGVFHSDAEPFDLVHEHKDVAIKLLATIDGTPYVGKLDHHHH